ncbi:MAG: 2-amino-4-oxopentanoate thiolase subunit OrtA [Chromatiales bacterium]|jgi:hypothetical protein
MAEMIERGAWVELHRVLLPAGARAPQVPEDTQRVPLEMRVKGVLLAPAEMGAEVEIETASGRLVRGILHRVDPPYSHGFGPPIPELMAIAAEVRALLGDA